jgi:hypothetical protein
LDHQDTKSANHRASFPCAAGSSSALSPSTSPLVTRRGTVLCAAACVIACRVPWTCSSDPETNGLSCLPPIVFCGYLPGTLFWAVIPTTPTTSYCTVLLHQLAYHHGGLLRYASWAEIRILHMGSRSLPLLPWIGSVNGPKLISVRITIS